MKKKILTIILSGLIALQCTGCGTEWGSIPTCRIVYANDTKVKYFVFFDEYKGGISPLYNSDGTLQVYEE